jgi:hypothetical protein
MRHREKRPSIVARFPFGRHVTPLPRSLLFVFGRRVGARDTAVGALALPVLAYVVDFLAELFGAIFEAIGLLFHLVGEGARVLLL